MLNASTGRRIGRPPSSWRDTLSIQSTSTNTVLLTWPVSDVVNGVLQSKGAVNGSNWTGVMTGPANIVNGFYTLTVPQSGESQFYRLVVQ